MPDDEVLAILGTGLMGGSLGLAALSRGLAGRVIGFDTDGSALEQARKRGAITQASGSPAEAVREATLVVIAAPISQITGVFQTVRGHLLPEAIVTDVGSTKSRIVASVASSRFIGGHPLAGSEREGIDAAEADLFTGCYWILTPTPETDPSAYVRLVRFIGQLEARVISLGAARHDELVALTSHLPQLIASTLMGFAAGIASGDDGLPLVTAGGFRDMTRIAASSPQLWVGIVRENRDAVVRLLKSFQADLASSVGLLENGDWAGLASALEGAREARRRLPGQPGSKVMGRVELRVPVPNRPGVLAEVANIVGEAGINIEDLDIVQSPEGGRGTIHLTVSGDFAAERAEEVLGRRGFSVGRGRE